MTMIEITDNDLIGPPIIKRGSWMETINEVHGIYPQRIGEVPVSFRSVRYPTVDVLKEDQLFALGAISDTGGTELVNLAIYGFDNSVLASEFWGVSGSHEAIKYEAHTTRLENINGTVKAYHIAFEKELIGANIIDYCYFYTLDQNGTATKTLVFQESYTDVNNRTAIFTYKPTKSFAVDSNGNIVLVLGISVYVAGVETEYAYIVSSSDGGLTWSAPEQKVIDYTYAWVDTMPSVEVDSSDNFYIAYSELGTPRKVFKLWKSINIGVSWTEITTVPSSPAIAAYELIFAISGTTLCLAGRSDEVFSVNYSWYSIDGGASWTTGSPTIPDETFWFRYIFMALNGSTIIMTGQGFDTNEFWIIKSTDGGVTWSNVGQIDPILTWPEYIPDEQSRASLYNDDDVFVYTADGSLYVADSGKLVSVNDGSSFIAGGLVPN